MNKKRIAGALVVLVLGAGLVGHNFNQAVSVETIRVERSLFADTFVEEGVVYAGEEGPVTARTGGIVEQVYVENGDRVMAGDALIAFDSTQLELKKKAVEGQLISLNGQLESESEKVKAPDLEAQGSALAIAEVNMNQYSADMDRAEELYRAGALSLQAYEVSEKAYRAAEQTYNMELARLSSLKAQNEIGDGLSTFYSGQIMQLQAELELIEDEIEKCVLYAQMSGIVTELDLEVGQAVEAMTPAMKIIDTDRIEIESMVLSEDAIGLTVGDAASIVLQRKGVEQLVDGHISKIDPSAIETVSALGLKERRVCVTVLPENTETLKVIAGADVDVSFMLYRSENALSVPKSAVFPIESGDGLWLVKDGKIVLQPIETGYEAARFIEVISGLEPGAHILKNFDADGIEEGVRVKSDNL